MSGREPSRQTTRLRFACSPSPTSALLSPGRASSARTRTSVAAGQVNIPHHMAAALCSRPCARSRHGGGSGAAEPGSRDIGDTGCRMCRGRQTLVRKIQNEKLLHLQILDLVSFPVIVMTTFEFLLLSRKIE